MFIASTATKAVMLLAAIFMPIVHKNSFKKAVAPKSINNTFIDRQLLFFKEYIFILTDNIKAIFPHFVMAKLFNEVWALTSNH